MGRGEEGRVELFYATERTSSPYPSRITNGSSKAFGERAPGATPTPPLHLAARADGRGCALRDDGRIAESQLSELRNMRVLLEEARVLARGLAYHRRAALETDLGRALEEVDRQIEDLRARERG